MDFRGSQGSSNPAAEGPPKADGFVGVTAGAAGATADAAGVLGFRVKEVTYQQHVATVLTSETETETPTGEGAVEFKVEWVSLDPEGSSVSVDSSARS